MKEKFITDTFKARISRNLKNFMQRNASRGLAIFCFGRNLEMSFGSHSFVRTAHT